MFPMTLGDS